jgi:predicted CXXCH cytochrome family protein
VFTAWSQSHHALAHRPVDAIADADAFSPPREVSANGIDYHLAWQGERPSFSATEDAARAARESYVAAFVLGHTPLRQYVVPTSGGRYQVSELAFDPGKKEWFAVFGAERRKAGEWGHWTGRGMNWNSMCAHCHLTDFKKNYQPATDTYASTWREHGIGCAQCHTAAPDHAVTAKTKGARGAAEISVARQRAQQTCAPCHARNELLTGELGPGADYADHFRVTLPTDPAVFYPDGQMRDEVFNLTSFLTSRMGGKAGVTCLDCHDPHSGRTTLPAQNNALCLQCHGPAPRLNAPTIDPVAHSHHSASSAGNQCVSCHMPQTTYMQRDPRHDHGFLKPDPLLTKELGIPNACNRCHTDQSVDWAIRHTESWYGGRMESRQRARTQVVAAAQAGAPDAADKLLAAFAAEDVPAWRATLLQLARPAISDAHILELARAATKDPEPLVRASAAQLLAAAPNETATLRPLLDDPIRLVRLDAAWRLSAELPADSSARRELDAYLAVAADQPGGQLRIGQDLFNRGRAAEAEASLRKAAAWDPNSADIHSALGLVLNQLGKSADAAASLWRAAQLAPLNANAAFDAALAFSAAQKPADAELALREALRRDARFDRAWYNLGLLLAQTNRAPAAIETLQRAEELAPNVADYPYALATVLWQRGEREAAIGAARRALRLDPTHRGAGQILRAGGQ